MKLKDIEGLLPGKEKHSSYRREDDEEFLRKEGRNEMCDKIAEKEIEIDKDALHDLILEQFDSDINGILRENLTNAIAKACPIKSKENK
ncbi:MAG TPA: hypothetical protein ENI23_06400 [bacterium]|nr:hypothetical protein [bacterium]